MTPGAKHGGPFSEMMGLGPSTVDIWVVYFTYTLTQTLVCIHVCILTHCKADDTDSLLSVLWNL